ncbi:hypothetical protein D3C73_308930 [compost metagenome]
MFSHSKTKLLSGVVATGMGNPLHIGLKKALRIEVWGTGTSTIQIEAAGESGVYRPLQIWDIAANGFVANSTISANGFYEIDVQGFNTVRANVKTLTGGNVSASGVMI